MTCYGQTNDGRWCQEIYETASRDAGCRARVLRKAGYAVSVGSMGRQITGVGAVNLALVNIMPGANEDTFGLPTVAIKRI